MILTLLIYFGLLLFGLEFALLRSRKSKPKPVDRCSIQMLHGMHHMYVASSTPDNDLIIPVNSKCFDDGKMLMGLFIKAPPTYPEKFNRWGVYMKKDKQPFVIINTPGDFNPESTKEFNFITLKKLDQAFEDDGSVVTFNII